MTSEAEEDAPEDAQGPWWLWGQWALKAELSLEAWVNGSTVLSGRPRGLGQKQPWQQSQKFSVLSRQVLSWAAAPASGTQRRKMGWEMAPRILRCKKYKALPLCGNECQGANAY